MKKKLLLFITVLSSFIGFSQIPTGYYSSATGNGYALKTQLKTIITNGHADNGYNNGLNVAYQTTDNDSFYENDNSVLDMYSENPTSSDPYNFNHDTNGGTAPGQACGNYTIESDCYNKEHIFPQGFFNKQNPMRGDIHHVVPTDGRVNGFRSNFPFGEVGANLISQSNISNPTQNGSKLGNCISPGYSGTAFEPIDEFKGDIARMLLYFATRYEDEVTSSSWDPHTAANNPLNGTNNQVYETWYIQLLNKWHTQDPVSQREIFRNNEAYNYQGNRNPFIDHPEYVANIWSAVLSAENNILLESISVYPNPTSINRVVITIPNGLEISSITLYSIIGSKVYQVINPKTTNNKIRIKDLKKGMYILKITSDKKSLSKKIIVN